MAEQFEYTPEINEDFYNRLSRRTSERGAQAVGQARSEALARGLEGDPFEASAVGSARAGTSNELADLDANLNYNVAGLRREERLGQQQRGYQVEDRDFRAAQDERQRNFTERLARLGYAAADQLQSDKEGKEYRRGYQNFIRQEGYNTALGGAKFAAGKFM